MLAERRVSVDDVANHLSLAKVFDARWIETRDLPAREIRRLWKFKLSEVDEWVRRQDSSVSDDEPEPEGGR